MSVSQLVTRTPLGDCFSAECLGRFINQELFAFSTPLSQLEISMPCKCYKFGLELPQAQAGDLISRWNFLTARSHRAVG